MISSYIEIIRPHQWYKNLLIFIGIIFAGKIGELNLFPALIIGFFMLSLVSGVNYIINDLRDLEKDSQHPEKKSRPLPSGKISKSAAIIYAVILLLFSIVGSFKLSLLFGISALAIFLTSQMYTFWLKNIVFADVITIAINFVWRAVSGTFLISVRVSPWLIICTFLLALFLALCKRKGDLSVLGENAPKHKEVLNHYTPELLNASIAITAATLILSYSLYSSQALHSGLLMLTIPVATFLVFRYLYLTYSGSPIDRNPETVFLDKQFAVGMALWLAMTLLILYIV